MWWKARRRELAGVAAALTAALALLTAVAPSASAGGPTSVLVTSPQSTEAEALYYSAEEYGKLQQLLDQPGAGAVTKPPEADLTRARQINVTWLLHDVTPWRHDRVYASSEDQDVWIHTATNLPESLNGHWHRAERPTLLRALLKELGVMGPTSDQGYPGIYPQAEQSEEPAAGTAGDTDTGAADEGTADEGAADSRTTASAAGQGTDWWWAIPGVAAGAVLALVLRPVAARIPSARLRREPGPRQELRDL
ncbi:hypothetical protein I2W78_14495 [Streptomyces spinoverrucosus]|nr:hypothetical protein [Streptomyces spinoverrucosus]